MRRGLRPDSQLTIERVLLSAVAALMVGLAAVGVLSGFSGELWLRLFEALAVFVTGALLLGGTVVLVMIRLAGWRQPEAEFEQLVQRSERLAAEDPWTDHGADYGADDEPDDDELFDPHDEDDFKALVRS